MYIPEAWGYQKARSFTSVGESGAALEVDRTVGGGGGLWKWTGKWEEALVMDRKVGTSSG